jgi:ABC-type multidrug transport system permease subunit
LREIPSDTIKHNSSSTKRMIIFGAVGGIIAGLVMAPFLMLTALLVGMPADTMPTAMGLAFGADSNGAMMTGFGLHILTSIIIGVIFGVIVANVSKLRIAGFTNYTLKK